MKFPWQILRKDARRLWVPLALWGVLITTRHVSDWRVATAVTHDGGWIERMKIFAGLLSIFELVVSYVLAGMLVLEDPALGSAAFWLMRPISGLRMFGAKLLGLVGLGLWPMLVSLPWWLAGVTGSREMTLSAGGLAIGQALIFGAGMLLAAFMESLNGFLAWSLGLFVLALVAITLGFREGLGVLTVKPEVGLQAGLLVSAIVATGLLYHFRRRDLALVVLAAGTIGAAALPLVSPG
jgi:hypothetical protein